jgi:hypothetical protein
MNKLIESLSSLHSFIDKFPDKNIRINPEIFFSQVLLSKSRYFINLEKTYSKEKLNGIFTYCKENGLVLTFHEQPQFKSDCITIQIG